MDTQNKDGQTENLRVIETARNVEAINKAIKEGFTALIRKVTPSPDIIVKYAILQHKETKEIKDITDIRDIAYYNKTDMYELIVDWAYYYPYHFTNPYAAYLIPKDIQVGERVFLRDLIEDYVGSFWNQSDKYRLKSCEAIWNVTDVEIQYDQKKDVSIFMG